VCTLVSKSKSVEAVARGAVNNRETTTHGVIPSLNIDSGEWPRLPFGRENVTSLQSGVTSNGNPVGRSAVDSASCTGSNSAVNVNTSNAQWLKWSCEAGRGLT